MDSLVTSRNDEKKYATYKNNKYTYLEKKEVESVEPVQINICQIPIKDF